MRLWTLKHPANTLKQDYLRTNISWSRNCSEELSRHIHLPRPAGALHATNKRCTRWTSAPTHRDVWERPPSKIVEPSHQVGVSKFFVSRIKQKPSVSLAFYLYGAPGRITAHTLCATLRAAASRHSNSFQTNLLNLLPAAGGSNISQADK